MRSLSFAIAVAACCVANAQTPVAPRDAAQFQTKDTAELGRLIFFDKRLSRNNKFSCASCHDSRLAWTDQKRVSEGVGGFTTRNSPTLYASGNQVLQFHDGRASHLEGQAAQPILNPVELQRGSMEAVANEFRRIEGYRTLFAKTFESRNNDSGVRPSTIAIALAAFQRTIQSTDAPADRAARGEKVSASIREGYALFKAKNCAECHKSDSDWRDHKFHNVGFPDVNVRDVGRQGVTNRGADFRAFKTPTLREVQATGPYGHAGNLTLRGTLDIERHAGVLTEDEKAKLVRFLETGFAGKKTIVLPPKEFPR